MFKISQTEYWILQNLFARLIDLCTKFQRNKVQIPENFFSKMLKTWIAEDFLHFRWFRCFHLKRATIISLLFKSSYEYQSYQNEHKFYINRCHFWIFGPISVCKSGNKMLKLFFLYRLHFVFFYFVLHIIISTTPVRI